MPNIVFCFSIVPLLVRATSTITWLLGRICGGIAVVSTLLTIVVSSSLLSLVVLVIRLHSYLTISSSSSQKEESHENEENRDKDEPK